MIEAVSAMLVCEDEIFVIRRQVHLHAFPGYHAFPGGKIDEADHLQSLLHPDVQQFPTAHLNALHRELDEELGFNLSRAFSKRHVIDISRFGTAITPSFEPHRFTAHYYKIVLSQKPLFKLDSNEIHTANWVKPAQILAQYKRGDAMMVPPMRHSIAQLGNDIQSRNAAEFNLHIGKQHLPCLEIIDGLTTLPIPSNTLPPATTTNALLLGDTDARQVLVDPSPKSKTVYQLLLNTLEDKPLDAILITHRHPDHHEHAMTLAREKQSPVMLTAQTLRRLKQEYGTKYVDNIELEIIHEGSEITRWKGQMIRAYELPGHDDGMVGLAPDGLNWFFICDLAQTNGSIVIPETGGDLAVYLRSLQRVIDLKPKAVLPSHGVPSGGTVLLKHTLAHRLDREKQVRAALDKGLRIEQMREKIYPLLDEHLIPLARQTLKQHIKKLKAEGNA